jgi:hypothetical protein
MDADGVHDRGRWQPNLRRLEDVVVHSYVSSAQDGYVCTCVSYAMSARPGACSIPSRFSLSVASLASPSFRRMSLLLLSTLFVALPTQYPDESHALIAAISDIIANLLVEQYRAGAQYLQLFESNAGELTPREFRDFLLPYLLQIATKVRWCSLSPHPAGESCLVCHDHPMLLTHESSSGSWSARPCLLDSPPPVLAVVV